MTILLSDVRAETKEQRWSQASEELGDTELLYADDTVLVGSEVLPIKTLLHSIEKHSVRYGLR